MDKYTGKKIINKSFHYKNPILFNTLIKNEILNPSELSSKYINIKEKHKKILKVNKLITNSSPVIILDEINKPEISISGDKNINIFDITSIKSSLNTEINDRKSLINDEQKNNDPLSIENLSLQSKNKISIDNSKEVSTEINDLRSLITNDLKSKAFFSVKKNKFEPFQETNIKLSNINNSIKKDRKYNSIYRKKLLQKFENIKNKQVFIDIYYIILYGFIYKYILINYLFDLLTLSLHSFINS
jgi:hypothetical protein